MVTTPKSSQAEFRSRPEWLIGDSVQKAWARKTAKDGNCVLPAYALEDSDASTKAPVLFTGNGLLVSPDMLVLGFYNRWHEVKAKAVPSYFRKLQRWEHGCDYALFLEYEKVAKETGLPVCIIVFEMKSPSDPSKESKLIKNATGSWLAIRLTEAREFGERRSDWPGGRVDPDRRGKRGMGGWLWPRDKMGFNPRTTEP